MVQRAWIKAPGLSSLRITNGKSAEFTLSGLKKWLEAVEVNPDYNEGLYGAEVEIPVTTLLMYVKDASLEVISE